ncbi:hypothetical protein AAAT87_15225, partial [Segatella sinensis]
SILAIENAKAPDLRTGIVLKSGAKVERILRYAFSAECAKLNSAETIEGQNHRLAPLYQYLTETQLFSLRQTASTIRRKASIF